MTTGEIGRTAFATTKAVAPGKPSVEANGSSTFDQVVSDFLKEAKKTPMERLRERVLKSHGLSEQQFDALPNEAKAGILREIAEAVKRSMKGVPSGTAATENGANSFG